MYKRIEMLPILVGKETGPGLDSKKQRLGLRLYQLSAAQKEEHST